MKNNLFNGFLKNYLPSEEASKFPITIIWDTFKKVNNNKRDLKEMDWMKIQENIPTTRIRTPLGIFTDASECAFRHDLPEAEVHRRCRTKIAAYKKWKYIK